MQTTGPLASIVPTSRFWDTWSTAWSTPPSPCTAEPPHPPQRAAASSPIERVRGIIVRGILGKTGCKGKWAILKTIGGAMARQSRVVLVLVALSLGCTGERRQPAEARPPEFES